jgi:hypothetical protein
MAAHNDYQELKQPVEVLTVELGERLLITGREPLRQSCNSGLLAGGKHRAGRIQAC